MAVWYPHMRIRIMELLQAGGGATVVTWDIIVYSSKNNLILLWK